MYSEKAGRSSFEVMEVGRMAHEQTVVALFARREDAHQAMARLIDSGIGPEHIGYIEPLDERESKDPAKGAAEGIAVGATSGAVVGAVLAAAAVGLIPGVGPALVAGALLPVLLGTVGGAVTGATAGGLLGGDVSSDEEPYFMQEVQAGRILVSAEVAPEETDATTKLLSSAALEVDRLGTATLHARLRHPAGDDAKG
jgi:hypothetical protein